jgi:hypothetical protein
MMHLRNRETDLVLRGDLNKPEDHIYAPIPERGGNILQNDEGLNWNRMATKISYFQEVLARKGSPSQVSIAQKAMGILSQLRPAPQVNVSQEYSRNICKVFSPAISAISSSVCGIISAIIRTSQAFTDNKGVIMIL